MGLPTGRTFRRTAFGLAVVGSLLLVWLSQGVGIIGADGDPVNRIYLGVVALGVLGGLVARFRPLGMAWALFTMAFALAVVAAVAVFGGLGRPYSGPLELVLLNGFFISVFAGAACLFRVAAGREREKEDARKGYL